MIRPPIVLVAALALALTACGGGADPGPSPSPSPTATPSPTETATPTSTATPSPSPSPAATPSPTETATPTSTATPSPTYRLLRFPIDPQTVLGEVIGEIGSRTVSFGADGPTAYDYALNDQPSDDPGVANRSGWNCRTHVEYEGIAAVDFYLSVGTTFYSTTAGKATLYAISVQNDFDRYGVDREPYLGDPDRASAPLNPFPSVSSGLGVYVVVEGEGFVTEYGHLDLSLSAEIVPANGFFEGFTADSDWATLFADVPIPRVATLVAEWSVRHGDVVGYSGDAGYSEAPHLHYTIRRDGGQLLCPTEESGFADGGWLFR